MVTLEELLTGNTKINSTRQKYAKTNSRITRVYAIVKFKIGKEAKNELSMRVEKKVYVQTIYAMLEQTNTMRETQFSTGLIEQLTTRVEHPTKHVITTFLKTLL